MTERSDYVSTVSTPDRTLRSGSDHALSDQRADPQARDQAVADYPGSWRAAVTTKLIKDRDGWLVPAAIPPGSMEKWTREGIERLELAMPYVKQRGTAVQAGGNLGIWPRLLVERYGFANVNSFEPDVTNFECLVHNTMHLPGMCVIPSAVGRRAGLVPWSRASEHKPGWHKVASSGTRPKEYAGQVPVLAIDELKLEACDLIALDVEGYELEALKGASATVERFQPVVIFEDLGRSRFEGFRRRSTIAYGHRPGAVQDWLINRLYHCVDSIKNDEVWVPRWLSGDTHRSQRS